jgi:hypothetical protein
MAADFPQCIQCAHFDFDSVDRMRCRAFPRGIPAEILENKIDHRHPFPGDKGIQYRPEDPEDLHPCDLASLGRVQESRANL